MASGGECKCKNPATGRWIKVGGETYKRVFPHGHKTLTPPLHVPLPALKLPPALEINSNKLFCNMKGLLAHEQGKRATMEDQFIVARYGQWTMLGVLDGHGGAEVAKIVSEQLPRCLLPRLMCVNPEEINQVKKIIENGFIEFDTWLHKSNPDKFLDQGCTAVVLFVNGPCFYIANLGDSRAMVLKPEFCVIASTKDHKPAMEKERIEKLGGVVYTVGCPRVNGNLATSRAFGDFALKRTTESKEAYVAEGWVSARPDVGITCTRRNMLFMFVLACDGLYDVLTNAEIATFISQNYDPQCAHKLVQHALEQGSTDNVSVCLYIG
jgi:serine/threonine protein phosphatase PrpC